MSKVFKDIKQGLLEAIDYEKGIITAKSKSISIEPTKEYSSKQIKNIRNKAELSQTLFARVMGVSKKTVEAWECGTNHPDGAATRLLSLIEEDPRFPFKTNIIKIISTNK